jgi:hypothetical protein
MVWTLVAVGIGVGVAWMLIRMAHGLRPIGGLGRPLPDGADVPEDDARPRDPAP